MTAAPIPLTRAQRLRRAANLINGSTALGLLLVQAAGLDVVRGPGGLLLAAGYRWRIPVARAFTIGNVVIFTGRNGGAPADPRQADPRLLGHEDRHASQYAVLLGLPFLPLYFAAAAWSWLRTGNPGSANIFERHAGLEAGGYPAGSDRRAARSASSASRARSAGREG